MFLRILKANPIVLSVITILMAISAWLWVGFSPEKFTFYSGNMLIFNIFLGWLNKFHVFTLVFGVFILFLQVFTWNSFINKNTLLKQSSYFPAFFFILFAVCHTTLIGIYPPLIATLFLILAFRRLAISYKKENALSEVFDAGMFIGIASMFYIYVAVFVLFLWIAILIVRSLVWREWVVALIGFLLPFAFILVWHTVFFASNRQWYQALASVIGNYRKHWSFSWKEWLLMIAVLATCVASFWLFINKLADNVVKAQKIWMLMLWFTVFAAISVVISPERDARSLFLMLPPVSFIFSNYFLKAKSRLWPEFLFLCLLVTVAINVLL